MTLPRAIFAAGALALAVTAIGCAPRQTGGDPAKAAASPAGTARSSAGGPGMAEIAVRVVPVTIDALVVEHQTSGTVNPVMQSQVAGQVGGIVARVLRRAGDRVEKGDAVVQLDDSQLRLSLKTAQASLEAARINLSTTQDTTAQANPKLDLQVNSAESSLSVAQRNYDSKKALFDLGGATGAEMDKAMSDLAMAQANLESARTALDQNRKADLQNIAQLKLAVDQAGFAVQQAQLNLEHASIKAPFAGRLVAVNVEEGEFVSQNAPAFIIASQQREVDFSVPPSDAPSLRVGAPVSLRPRGEELRPPHQPDRRRPSQRGRCRHRGGPGGHGPHVRRRGHGALLAHPCPGSARPHGLPADQRGPDLRVRRACRQGGNARDHDPRRKRQHRGRDRGDGRGPW